MQTLGNQAQKKQETKSRRPALTLLSAVLIIVGIWGIILPRIAELPAMQEKIQRFDQKGINPNAFFYTDHPNAFKKY